MFLWALQYRQSTFQTIGQRYNFIGNALFPPIKQPNAIGSYKSLVNTSLLHKDSDDFKVADAKDRSSTKQLKISFACLTHTPEFNSVAVFQQIRQVFGTIYRNPRLRQNGCALCRSCRFSLQRHCKKLSRKAVAFAQNIK